jgi:hypothetical protein
MYRIKLAILSLKEQRQAYGTDTGTMSDGSRQELMKEVTYRWVPSTGGMLNHLDTHTRQPHLNEKDPRGQGGIIRGG